MQNQETNKIEVSALVAPKKSWSKPEVEALPVEETSNGGVTPSGDLATSFS